MVDELVPRNGVNPWHKRRRWIVGVTPRVDRHQRFLCQVLCLGGAAADPSESALIVRAQAGAQPTQQGTIGSGVAALARAHQPAEFGFVRRHVLSRKRTGFGYKGFRFERELFAVRAENSRAAS